MEALKKLMNILKNADQNKSLFLDSNFLIYLMEDYENYKPLVNTVLTDVYDHKVKMVTSTITVMECVTGLMKTEQNPEQFFGLTDALGLKIIDLTKDIALVAANVRAAYPAIKQMDSIQLATSLYIGCDWFITNDKRLNQFKEVPVIILSDYQKGMIS